MPTYIVPVDVITVHMVPVLAPTPEAAQAEADRIVTGDWETWFDHAEPVVVGDAHTEAEWDAEQERLSRTGTSGQPGPLSASQPKDTGPAAKPRAPRTDHHADGTDCPPTHRHTSAGKPLTERCPGRAYSTATCTCGWTTRSTLMANLHEPRNRHLPHHRSHHPPRVQHPTRPGGQPGRDDLPRTRKTSTT
ncbi:hypothetical protein ACFWXO_39590 [Kitasatospora sp. NPDC059088]|uniref:hypothetical protein n=1 Tax=Kitasatospora sp. NPDC059088 TaxID=3346722 RepID=UPI0036B51132